MCCLLCRLYSKAMATTRGNERMFAGRVLWAMFCGPRSVVCVRSGVPICRDFPSHYLVGRSPAICISDRLAGSSLAGCSLTGLSLTMSRLIGVSGFIDTPFGTGGKAMRRGGHCGVPAGFKVCSTSLLRQQHACLGHWSGMGAVTPLLVP